MGNWNDVSRARRVDRPLEAELKALDSRSCAIVVGSLALFPSPFLSVEEELLPSGIFGIVGNIGEFGSIATNFIFFPLFHSFLDQTSLPSAQK